MRPWLRFLLAAFTLILGAFASAAQERVTAPGRVLDPSGKPLENAIVVVHSAGVKKGYSLFCPTCYRDCGKRTLTGADGSYVIGGLDPELIFTLVAVKDGYLASYIPNVDPVAGPALDAKLKPKPAINDVVQLVRGKIVDTGGKPLRGAIIQPDFAAYKGANNLLQFSAPPDWINELTVTNDEGEFEIAAKQPAVEMTLRVVARAMAPKNFSVPTGGRRRTLTVVEGDTVRGRLIYKGKPVAGAEVALKPHDASPGRWYPEVRIGTQKDGTFAITNVPPGRVWLVYPTMESLAQHRAAADPIVCETKSDGQKVDLGDIHLKSAHTLSGKIILAEGMAMPPDMRVSIWADRSGDTQVVKLGSDGGFRFDGLSDGIYSLNPSVKSYRLANECMILCRSVEIVVRGDMTDLVIKMEPELDGASRN
jgi:hypothetical protein